MTGANPLLDFLLSDIYRGADLHAEHLADLRRSGLTNETIRLQRFRSIPPGMMSALLGFPALAVLSACLYPFPDPRGGWMHHVRMKVFPPFTDRRGQTVKYLQPPSSGVRLFFPVAAMAEALAGPAPLWLVEGEKKALAVAQLGLAVVGFCGIHAWHHAGSRALVEDFDAIALDGRTVELVPDGDWRTNLDVHRGAFDFAEALERRGSRVRLVVLPGAAGEGYGMSAKVGADDFITKNGATAETLNRMRRVETWPILHDAALHGLAGRVVEAIAPHTEAADVATLAYFLTGFGNLLGPSPYAQAGHDVHPCRFNMALVGQTSKGRKGTVRSTVMEILKKVDEAWWARNRIPAGLSTGEGLIFAVRDEREGQNKQGEIIIVNEGIEDKRFLADEPELAVVLARMEREGNSLSAIIRQAWDSGNLQVLTRKDPLRATDAHISVMSNITMDELRSTLTATARANGFANRFMFFLVKRSKSLPEPEPVPEPKLEALAAELREVLKFAETVTIIKRDTAAGALWAAIYEKLSAERPGMLGAVTARAEAQALRLGVIYALLDRSPLVRPEHLKAALALWDYADASAARIFGDRLGDAIADVILENLQARGSLTRLDITILFNKNMPKDRIDAALAMLQAAGRARRKPPEATGGRPAEVWEPVTR